MNTLNFSSFILLTLLLSLTVNKVTGQSVSISKERERLSSIKDSVELINSMNHLGMLYQAKNVDSCFYYGIKAKALSSKLLYAKGEVDADNVIGMALNLRGLRRESLEMYSNVLNRYRQQADTANIVQVLMNMAMVYADITDTIKSRIYFQQALFIGRSLKRDSILSMLYVNYCMYTPKLSEDSVNYYLGKSLGIAQRYKSEWVPVLVLQEKAIRLMQNRRKDVMPLLEEALDKSRKLKMEMLEMNTLVIMGTYYSDTVDKALKYYHRAYELMTASGYKNLLIPAARTILETTKLTGNVAAINRMHEQMEDALANENQSLKSFIGDYVKYNAIQEDNKLLELSNHNKQTKIWLLIVISALSGSLAVFIYWQYRVSSRLNRKISEQNSAMQRTLIALEESQEENTRMMKMVAHDLRDPIGAITSTATLLLDEVHHSADDLIMLNLIKTSGESSLELTKDLLLINSRGDELRKEKIDMYQLLHYCVDMLKFKAVEKNQYIRLQIDHVILNINREKIWRVISNLITNAIKFSPNGANIDVYLEERPYEVVLAVKDNGIGIAAETRDKIFQMFTESRRSGTAGEQSFGLGLAISKQIVEAHKGRIWYESELGSGTTFFVALPVE
jgi:signal transduction histidine kinase